VIPDTVNGLPLHALVLHATVVLIPLAGLLGVVFAIPRLRAWATVPLPLVAVAAAVSALVTAASGQNLKEAGGQGGAGLGGPVLELVEEHQELAQQLVVMTLIYAVLAVVAAVVAWRARRRAPDGRTGGALLTGLAVLLVLGAVVVGVQTFRVGDVGPQAVWNPTGATDYSTRRLSHRQSALLGSRLSSSRRNDATRSGSMRCSTTARSNPHSGSSLV
jgi:hypothetical protein